jgi:hypothetical protein
MSEPNGRGANWTLFFPEPSPGAGDERLGKEAP